MHSVFVIRGGSTHRFDILRRYVCAAAIVMMTVLATPAVSWANGGLRPLIVCPPDDCTDARSFQPNAARRKRGFKPGSGPEDPASPNICFWTGALASGISTANLPTEFEAG